MNIKIKTSYSWAADCQFNFDQVFLILGGCHNHGGITYKLIKKQVIVGGVSRDQLVLVQIN